MRLYWLFCESKTDLQQFPLLNVCRKEEFSREFSFGLFCTLSKAWAVNITCNFATFDALNIS